MTNLTLDERHEFESLLAEYANAEMDCVRATGRVHNAMHAVEDYVNARTKRIANETAERKPDVVPTGTPPACCADWTMPVPPTDIANGVYHTKGPWVPVVGCGCNTCGTTRARAGSSQTVSELVYAPNPATSGGN